MEIIITILNLLLSSGIGVLLFYRSSKRKHAAEANTAEQSTESIAIANMRESAVEWKAIAEAREEKLNRKDALIDRLYMEKAEDRRLIHEQAIQISQLTIERNNAEFIKCEKRRCNDRTPPNELF